MDVVTDMISLNIVTSDILCWPRQTSYDMFLVISKTDPSHIFAYAMLYVKLVTHNIKSFLYTDQCHSASYSIQERRYSCNHSQNQHTLLSSDTGS